MSKYGDHKRGITPTQPSQGPYGGKKGDELGYTPPQPAQNPTPTGKPQGGGDKK